MTSLSVNRNVQRLVGDLCDRPDEYGVVVEESDLGTRIVDAGIKAEGGLLAGKTITEVCLGGLGKATISSTRLGGFRLPSISVFTDHPAISTLGSQLAGWRVKVGDYSAVGSGPARALALKPKSVYKKISYKDESDVAVLVLEATEAPPEEAVTYIAETCQVAPDKLSIIMVPTSSLAGATQVSGRIAETGVHKLNELGFDPKLITHAWGSAPILPVDPDFVEAMGRTNDAILYGGFSYYTVDYQDDGYLENLVQQSVSSASRQYGRPFAEIFREAAFDFYRIDPGLFAPAVVTITNAKTGKTFTAGKTDVDVLKRSMGL